MDTITFTTTISLPKQFIQDLLCCAFEGGSNYWYCELEPNTKTSKAEHASDRFYEDLMNGFRLKDNETGKVYTIGTDAFPWALKLMHDKFGLHFNDVRTENTDTDTGDVFLQLLCFGDVIYG